MQEIPSTQAQRAVWREGQKHRGMAVFVFLHSYDSGPEQGQRFVEVGRERVKHALVELLEYRFPAAPTKPSSTGRPVRLWYTIQTMQENGVMHFVSDPVLFVERVAWLRGLINGLIAQGTPASEIVLCGVRQGSGVAGAAVVLLQDMQLAGVVMILGFMSSVETFKGWIDAQGGPGALENTATPILAIHGCNDANIDVELQQKSDRFFVDAGYHNYHTQEAMLQPAHPTQVTDEMWMIVWQFVLQILGKKR